MDLGAAGAMARVQSPACARNASNRVESGGNRQAQEGDHLSHRQDGLERVAMQCYRLLGSTGRYIGCLEELPALVDACIHALELSSELRAMVDPPESSCWTCHVVLMLVNQVVRGLVAIIAQLPPRGGPTTATTL